MRNNRTDLSASRHAQSDRRSGKPSILANQKVGQRQRQSSAAGESAGLPARRFGGRRSRVSLFQRAMLRLLHGGFWTLAAIGLMLKWVVELFTGDDTMRQGGENTAIEPTLDEWDETLEEDRQPHLPEGELVEPWTADPPEVVPSGLRDFESMKMATLEAEEQELSEAELNDQAASLRARLERVRHES